MKNYNNFLIILLLSLLCTSCVKEIIEDDIQVIHEYPKEVQVATIYGHILNESSSPIADVVVYLDNAVDGPIETNTDENGYYVFHQQKILGDIAKLRVIANNKFNGYRSIAVQSQKVYNSDIILLDKVSIGTFLSSNGGVINSPSGVSLEFPPNAIQDASGMPYDGEVEVLIAYIDPTLDDYQQMQVGGAFGLNEVGRKVALANFGTLRVELKSPSGESLNLIASKKAKLIVPVPSAFAGVSDNNISLMHFEENEGEWKEEEVGQKVNEFFEGEVSHFSTWSFCALISNTVSVSGNINLNQNGIPFDAQSHVKFIYSGTPIIHYHAQTSIDGHFYIPIVLAGESLELVVQNTCENIIYQEDFDPFDSDQDIGTISIETDPIDYSNLSAQIYNCDSTVSESPYARFCIDELFYTRCDLIPVTNGHLNYSFPNCSQSLVGTLDLVDLTTLMTTDQIGVDLNNGDVSLGTYLCDTFTQHITVYINDAELFTKFLVYWVGSSNPDNSIQAGNSSSGISIVSNDYILGTGPVALKKFFIENTLPGNGDIVQYGYKNFNPDPSSFDIELNVTEFIPNQNDPTNPYLVPDLLKATFSGTIDQVDPDTGNFIDEVSIYGTIEIN